ncbi:hypothetical protein BCR44DRAFT_62256 [Catenaria anguillulae PL171]|uniref:DUF962 domain protein n=1 Tax=Catenaria anguillulae PL171 TaxID=765915 RepID=A0A1Y2I2G5_9FUNG|nr:hypothetical protein BCR44DRAFT_62256 [Catenaria anguillulae PL171]
MGYFNIEEQFVFYGAYHNNGWNKFVHIICVPMIMWSVMVWLAGLGEVVPLDFVHRIPPYQGWVPEANAAFFVGLAYLSYYLILEPLATLTYAPVLFLKFVTSGWFAANVKDANTYALYVHIASWILQIGAHYVFEKRAPAFLDSIHQAFVMAPLFVWMEVLFLCGYRPEMEARLQARIDKEIAAFRSGEMAKKGGKAKAE